MAGQRTDPGIVIEWQLVHVGDDGTCLRRYKLGDGSTSGSVVIAFGSLWVSSSHQPLTLRIPVRAP